jgi:hypothetical protein
LKVTKRDGRLEPINLDKIHRVINWAAEAGLDNVSVSQVELKSHIQFYNGIRTDDIHETIIKAAADLISKKPLITSIWLPVWPFSICAKSLLANSSRRICTTTWPSSRSRWANTMSIFWPTTAAPNSTS